MKTYWFRKRKGVQTSDRGSGFAPVSWEGWVVVYLYFASIAATVYFSGILSGQLTLAQALGFTSSILVSTTVVILLAKSKTEPS